MLPLYKLVQDTLEEIRGVEQGDPARFSRVDVVRAINEAKDLMTANLLRTREHFLSFVNATQAVSTITIPTSTTDPEGRVIMPADFFRVVEAQVQVGESWRTIGEMRRGEGAARCVRGSAALTENTEYYLLGRFMYFDPIPSTGGSMRLYYERWIPDFWMGRPFNYASASFQMRQWSNIDNTEGEDDPCLYDDVYIGHECVVYEGGSQGSRKAITAYNGNTAGFTVDSDYSPALSATSKICSITPFFGPTEACNKMLKCRAAIQLLTTKRQEDVSGWEARYNELENQIVKALSNRTPGNRQAIPFDAGNG